MSIKAPQSRTWSGKQLVIGIVILYVFLQLTTAARIYGVNYLDDLNMSIGEMFRDRLLGTVIGLVFIMGIITFTRYLLKRGTPAYRVILSHVLLIFPVTFLWYRTFAFFALMLCQIFGDCKLTEEEHLYAYLINANTLVPIYLLIVAVTYTYYYVRRDNEHQLQQSQLETKVLQARMKMLRSQLHPHFLFNTLNSINSLMDIDVKKAQVMIVDLADLLRKVLDWKDTQKVPLKDELQLLQRYVDIEKMRFSEDLSVNWSIAKDVQDVKVPALLLQPLVENAIHHGFSSAHLHLEITIEAQRENGHLLLRVSDNGQGFREEDQAQIFDLGTGLQNTKERLATMYGDAYRFSVINTHPGVVSEVAIPLKQG
ncbi:MAG: histidine kinase [Bacteroidota bacterium]